MDIVTACDEIYLPHAATMLCSLLENNVGQIKVYLLHDGIKKEKVKLLGKFLNHYGAEFEDFEIHDAVLSSLKITPIFNSVIYFRLLIPEILSNSLSKVLYLDCDLIVRKPIGALWNIDLDDHLLAAVEDNVLTSQKERLGLPSNSDYFNSGVLLINLDQWRHQSFHLKVIEYVKNNPEKLTFPDQDGLNFVADGNWIKLPTNWNVQHAYFFRPGYPIRFADIIADPEIVHFTGTGLKPWQNGKSHHPFTSEYRKYRLKTPWNKYKLENWPKRGAKEVIKGYAKNILTFIGRNNLAWKINSYIYKTAGFIQSSRVENVIKRAPQTDSYVIDEIKSLIPTQEVVAGPFKGMKYPSIETVSCSIAPKLLGTYEIEIQEIVEEICHENYSTIINIGCSEGYYAVGFALRMPEVKVHAYDISQKARELCQAMTTANGVKDRVKTEDLFTMRSIKNTIPNNHGLIFCDCGGAEEFIFYKDGENWLNLINNFDLLIEIHDFKHPGNSKYIYDLFSASHYIQIINSVNDLLRPRIFDCPIISDKDSYIKEELMAEKRAGIMTWFYMKRKNPS